MKLQEPHKATLVSFKQPLLHPLITVALCCEIVFSSWAAVALRGTTVWKLALQVHLRLSSGLLEGLAVLLWEVPTYFKHLPDVRRGKGKKEQPCNPGLPDFHFL